MHVHTVGIIIVQCIRVWWSDLSTWSSLHHVSGNVVRQEDSLVQEVRQCFSTGTASSKWWDEDVQECRQESKRPSKENEYYKPDNSPAPLQCHLNNVLCLIQLLDKMNSWQTLLCESKLPLRKIRTPVLYKINTTIPCSAYQDTILWYTYQWPDS